MNLITMARVFGVMFLAFGILGFVPGITPMHDTLHSGAGDDYPPLKIGGPGHGMLLGLFHVNVLHNIVHAAFGAWGLVAAAASLGASRTYFRGVGVIYLLLALLGIIPATNTTFGLVPIHGADVGLHIALSLPALYLGFVAKATDVTEPRADAPVV